MDIFLEKNDDIEILLCHQLENYWIDYDKKIIHQAIPQAMNALYENFIHLPMKRFYNNGNVQFSPWNSVQWMIFLYRLSHEIYKSGGGATRKRLIKFII